MSLRTLFDPGHQTKLASLGLLILRLWAGLIMLGVHGWSKLTSFSTMSERFSDPLGIGPAASLALVVFTEIVFAALLSLGFFTRLAAIALIVDMAVAFVAGHGARLTGQGNGELAFLFLGIFVALLVTGPGRYSVDASRFGSGRR